MHCPSDQCLKANTKNKHATTHTYVINVTLDFCLAMESPHALDYVVIFDKVFKVIGNY
jgi:hypothetical protein